MTATTAAPLTVGQRVAAILYGQTVTGTVTRITTREEQSIVWVKFDGAKYERWAHRVSLRAI